MTIDTDFDRIVHSYEPHYFAAQARGFALIRKIEECLKEAESFAGKYYGSYDLETDDMIIEGECDDAYDAALRKACDIAYVVARSNGYGILRAQQRNDEAASLVYAEYAQIFVEEL